MKTKVFVLGHRGMLGHVVSRYLSEQGFNVVTSDKRFVANSDCALFEDIMIARPEYIINCIGLVKQRDEIPHDMFLVNSILPIQLTQLLSPSQKLIHVSSDCVFSGKIGNYSVDHRPDPIDIYGASKLAGEIIKTDPKVSVLRTSIIGPENYTTHGLMEWLKTNPLIDIPGYDNHFWNGVTTLELAKFIETTIIMGSSSGLSQVTSQNTISKFELLQTMNELFKLNKNIIPFSTPISINRSLLGSVTLQPITQQLEDLEEWY